MFKRAIIVLPLALLLVLLPQAETTDIAQFNYAEPVRPTQPDESMATPRPEVRTPLTPDRTSQTAASRVSVGSPIGLRSAALGVNASVYDHNLDEEMVVNPIKGMIANYVGWKFHEESPIMVAGHVTDVFANATSMELGDQVTLVFESNTEIEYEVVETAQTFDQEGAGNIDYTGIAESFDDNLLYLITCGRASDGDPTRPDGTSAVNKLVVLRAIP